ncbi:MAG: putative toxin-antitoxin system toxin component, PIN family [Planctomycetes bacterium RBG_13_60_9]|nr:MAG: putative toxin-antitoxin system toxin component, PIN family [Planctomycetes bacterium RBG_13_60_9]
MKAVLDTNVFISGLFFAGPPHRILQAWRDGRVQLVVCPEILAEYRQVALRLGHKYKGVDILPLIDLVTVRSQIVRTLPLAKGVCEDPKDDVFLACALAGKTPAIISGDRHLLNVSGFAGIQILRPKAFVDAYL